ncbi:PTS glucose transporter subunit IIA [Saccharibacillus sp. CPCC 101409]|uniref:PTS sugar transporter subunit IIA n=1 Tax=Saccharibacillus sp. CPCC 101409 TaxID=3058041 RepID=UPI0026726B52|nr:PTS glucose transporter subunit IIA [Saccharibacillus sp. CPCC 101409]MDO3412150.1 PTS glucose transporter subunit IIA [Saccharibacillus sp. CPCC 101409]
MAFWSKKKADKLQSLEVLAPLSGKAVSLSEVPDPAFAEKLMGEGIAIVPSEGRVLAPFDGVIAHLPKSKHAVMLEHETGAQVLIHVGVDTVSMKGEGFDVRVSTGDRVKAGQLLIEFDMQKIEQAGYPSITSIIAPNGVEAVTGVQEHEGGVTAGRESVLTLQLS